MRQQSYDLARWQRQAGLTTELQQAQALTLLRQTESSLPPYEQAELQALQQLQALAGGELGALLAALQTTQALPSFTAPAGLGIPAEVLRQRPDVQAQEQGGAGADRSGGAGAASALPVTGLVRQLVRQW